ncbi:hypothetical protein [Acetobacter pasteurianus]|uniref:hypothetical protein n=1 Tax=Acetobacter pasteurianus TaxID=438 RepID=UPI000686A567|nr:hypothetical protein [Acetobacter pasteurianus]GCD50339.1 hypothetical protein NBRC106471_1895 [Acetobacter pasteurianus subsp. pasteurianus LMG 1262 = NBRC 106471]
MKYFSLKIKEQYKGVEKVFCDYFNIYGGFLSLISSPYLHLALFLSIISFGLWSTDGWWDLPLSILPSLISFTLAGYAMLTALGNDQFRAKMARTIPPHQESVFMQVSASFAHFIIVQTIGLLLALISKAHFFRSIYLHTGILEQNFLKSEVFISIHGFFLGFHILYFYILAYL